MCEIYTYGKMAYVYDRDVWGNLRTLTRGHKVSAIFCTGPVAKKGPPERNS